ISGVTFPAFLGTSASTDSTSPYDSATYTFSNPVAPGSQTIVAANGVTNPAAETSSDSLDVQVDGTAPTTIEAFPLNNGSYQVGSDTGGPTDTITLGGATHAYLSTLAGYTVYYGTALGGGGFTLHSSASDPSGVDTVTFPDLSGTAGFGGTGGTSANSSSADPF